VIDIHCHLLPGIDDGPRSLREAMDLARVLVAQGVSVVAATPHVSHVHPNTRASIVRSAEELRGALDDAGIPLQIVAAAELSASKALEFQRQELEDHALGGVYILVEPPKNGEVAALETVISTVFSAGLTPIVAHPERMRDARRDPMSLASLREDGVLFQITASSLVNRRSPSHRTAWMLVQSSLGCLVASDAHGAERRPPQLAEAHRLLTGALGEFRAGLLTLASPLAVVSGRQVLPELPDITESREGAPRGRLRFLRPRWR
jgi:protein-tyrosine phosphatase